MTRPGAWVTSMVRPFGNEDLETFLAHIRSSGTEYWRGDGKSAAIYRGVVDDDLYLGLTLIGGDRFHLTHFNRGLWLFAVPRTIAADSKPIEILIEFEPYSVETGWLVSRAEAEHAARVFIDTGKPDPELRWATLEQLRAGKIPDKPPQPRRKRIKDIGRHVRRVLAERAGVSEREVLGASRLAADLGLQALDLVEIEMELEEDLEITLSELAMESVVTVDDFVRAAEEARDME